MHQGHAAFLHGTSNQGHDIRIERLQIVQPRPFAGLVRLRRELKDQLISLAPYLNVGHVSRDPKFLRQPYCLRAARPSPKARMSTCNSPVPARHATRVASSNYLTTVEGLKLAAQTFDRDVKRLSCCAG